MSFIYVLIICLAAIFILFVLTLMGKRHSVPDELKSAKYAHRGLHNKPTVPENSLSAFEKAVLAGYGIELDVHLMRDGRLAVIHDSSLKRTAGADINIEDLTAKDLENYYLEGTTEKIPTLKQVLNLVDGKVPLIIELKSQSNTNQLCSATVKELEDYKGLWCMESFDPRCVLWFRKNRPDIIRGQLSQNFFKDKDSKLSLPLKIILTLLFFNFLSRPDFVAFRLSHKNTLSFVLATKLWGIDGFVWTIRTKEALALSDKLGFTPIFEEILTKNDNQ